MVKRNAIATKLTKICTQTQKRAFDVAVHALFTCHKVLASSGGIDCLYIMRVKRQPVYI